jgi:hypothetical protein
VPLRLTSHVINVRIKPHIAILFASGAFLRGWHVEFGVLVVWLIVRFGDCGFVE